MRSPELPSNGARLLRIFDFSVVRQRTAKKIVACTCTSQKTAFEVRSVNSVYCKLDKHGPDSSISEVSTFQYCIVSSSVF